MMRRGFVEKYVRGVEGGTAGVPSVGRGEDVLGVGQELEPFRDDLLVDGKDAVLETKSDDRSSRKASRTYAGLSREIDDGDEFTSVSIDEGFVPLVFFLVLDLSDIGESGRSIRAGEVFE